MYNILLIQWNDNHTSPVRGWLCGTYQGIMGTSMERLVHP
jgi:hypothetical protein